jgi:hypothetical protein
MNAPNDDQDDLDVILGKPALLEGENRQAYEKLYAQLLNEHVPKTFMERLHVRELTDYIWETMRFKRLGTRAVGAGYREALQLLLAPCVSYMTHKANELARDYYSDSAKRRELAKAQLDSYGITDDQIQAKALSMIAAEFGFFDRLVANRISSRNALVKQYAKEQKRSKQSDRSQDIPDVQPADLTKVNISAEANSPMPPAGGNDNGGAVVQGTPDLPKRHIKRRVEV